MDRPPSAPGHWIPEMVRLAGGEPVLGTAGAASVRVDWSAVHAARPDLIVVAPCGYGRAGAQRQADAIAPLLPLGVPVHAVDAHGCWAGPGPRIVDGIEELAGVLRSALGGQRAAARRTPHGPLGSHRSGEA